MVRSMVQRWRPSRCEVCLGLSSGSYARAAVRISGKAWVMSDVVAAAGELGAVAVPLRLGGRLRGQGGARYGRGEHGVGQRPGHLRMPSTARRREVYAERVEAVPAARGVTAGTALMSA